MMIKKMEEPNIFINLPTSATETLADPDMVMYWKHLENRIIWIDGGIDEDTLSIVDYLLYFNREDRDLPIEERPPIKLLFNSNGGSLDVADALISAIKASKTPVYGYAMGTVASAASSIYLSTHYRYALENATFLLHKGSASMSGNYNELIQGIESYQKQVAKMVQFYIDNTTIPEEVIQEKIKTDWYLDTNEAVDSGIVDKVIESLDEIG